MEANSKFNNLLQNVYESGLNFKIDLSPFSAIISVKKSFIKDKSGNTMVAVPTIATQSINQKLKDQIFDMESVIFKLKEDHAYAVDNCVEAYAMKKNLEEELDRVTVKQKKNELESDEFQKVIELNKNYKKEIKSVTA